MTTSVSGFARSHSFQLEQRGHAGGQSRQKPRCRIRVARLHAIQLACPPTYGTRSHHVRSKARLAACFLVEDMGLITCVEPSDRCSVVAAENVSRSGTGLSRMLLSR
jgi:hypothetical protein